MKFIPANTGKWILGNGYKKNILLKDINLKGTLVQIVVVEPNDEVKPHLHKKMTEVFHILEGEGTMIIDNKTFHLKPGDTLTCEPNEVHSTKNSSNKIFKFVVFKTNAEEGDSYWL